jgi:hypothetical protein
LRLGNGDIPQQDSFFRDPCSKSFDAHKSIKHSKMVEHAYLLGREGGGQQRTAVAKETDGEKPASACDSPPPLVNVDISNSYHGGCEWTFAEIDVTSAAGLLMKRGHHLQEEFGVRMSFQKRTQARDDCTLVISAPERQKVERAAQGIMQILEDPTSWKQGLQRTKLHIFVDDSNVYYGGINQCAEGEGVNMKALLRSIHKGRWTEELTVVGSGTGNEPRWRAYDEAGYTKHVLPKGKDGHEIGVDDTLMSLIMRETDKQYPDLDQRRLVVVTGDGNDNMGRVSFPEVVESAIRKGWRVELCSWDQNISSKWRKISQDTCSSDSADARSFEEMFTKEQFTVTSLSDHRDSIICPVVARCHGSPRASVSANAAATTKPVGGQKILAIKATMEAIREEINRGEYERAGELSGLKEQLDEAEQQAAATGGNNSTAPAPPPGFAERPPRNKAGIPKGTCTTSRGPDSTIGFNLARTGAVAEGATNVATITASPTVLPKTGAWRSRSAIAAAAAGKDGASPPSPPAVQVSSWRAKSVGTAGYRGSARSASHGSSKHGSSLEELATSMEGGSPTSSLFQAYNPSGRKSFDVGSKTSTRYAVCKDYAACGHCTYGNRCHFQHPGKPGVGLGGKTMCHSWAGTGECELKSSCAFAHPEVCRFGSSCAPRGIACKCDSFHPCASAARAVAGEHSPSSSENPRSFGFNKKQNFQPPARNFHSFDVHAGRSKRPFGGSRHVETGSFGVGGGFPPTKVSMPQEGVLELADRVSVSLSFKDKDGFDFGSQQAPMSDLDDMFDSL